MPQSNTDVVINEKIKVELSEPKRYKVVFLNDNKTPIDFVIEILRLIFAHTEEKAKEITMQVHHNGSGVAGVYSYEIAEQKGVEATNAARTAGFPLQIKIDAE